MHKLNFVYFIKKNLTFILIAILIVIILLNYHLRDAFKYRLKRKKTIYLLDSINKTHFSCGKLNFFFAINQFYKYNLKLDILYK